MVDVILSFGWTRVGVIGVDESYSSNFATQFNLVANSLGLIIMSQQYIQIDAAEVRTLCLSKSAS